MATALRTQAVQTSIGAGFRPKDISDEIYNIRPTRTPFLTMLMSLRKKKVDDYEYRMNIQQIDPVTVTVLGVNGGASTVNVSVADATLVRKGHTLRNSLSVAPLVTDINYATGDITLSSVAGFNIADVPVLGSAGSEELSNAPTPITRVPDQITNFVETLRDSWGQSRHVEHTRYYGGPRHRINRELALWEHKRSINRGIIINGGTQTVQNGQNLYKNYGLFASITTNVHPFSGGHVTFEAVRANLTTDVRFMVSDRPWLICSRKGTENIELMIKANTVPTDYQEAGVLNIRWFSMANKKIFLLEEDCLESNLQYLMALVDPDSIEIVTTADQESGQQTWMSETVIGKEKNPNGTDGTIGFVDSDFGLRVDGEQRNAIWSNAVDAITT